VFSRWRDNTLRFLHIHLLSTERSICGVPSVSFAVTDVSEEPEASITADAYKQICPDVLILHATTWLLIGHIRLTRDHVLGSGPARVYIQCGMPLTVLQFLREFHVMTKVVKPSILTARCATLRLLPQKFERL
jgi:hypothetical protein